VQTTDPQGLSEQSTQILADSLTNETINTAQIPPESIEESENKANQGTAPDSESTDNETFDSVENQASEDSVSSTNDNVSSESNVEGEQVPSDEQGVDTEVSKPISTGDVQVEAEQAGESHPNEPEIDHSKTIEILQNRIEQESNAIEQKNAEIDHIDEMVNQIERWEARHLGTVTEMVLTKAGKNLEDSEQTLKRFERDLDELEIPESGAMLELRRIFLRDLKWTWPPVSILTGILLYMPHCFNPSVRAAAAAIYAFLGITMIGVITYWLVIMVLTTLLHLVNYYRGWSRFERKVALTSWKLRVIAANADEVRGEVIRLREVVPQLREWLEMIARSLRHPWSVADEWMETSSLCIERESLPFSLRLAQALEDEGPELIAMERFAAEHYMVRGWRARLLEDQIAAIRQKLGFAANRFSVDQIDNDVVYSPNGPRKLVLQNISDVRILRTVGVRQLLPLMHDVQMEVVDKVRPPVVEARDNPFESIVRAEIDSNQGLSQSWDEFLAFSIQDKSRPRTALSRNGFSDAGLASGLHDRIQTFLVAPRRFADDFDGNTEVAFHGYSANSKMSMEIVIRHDFVGPVSKSDLRLFAASPLAGHIENMKVVRPMIESADDGV
jgi:rubrerythrin